MPLFAARAETIDLEAMCDQFVVCRFAYAVEDVFDVVQVYVFSRTAAHADEVVMVAFMAEPVADAAIVEDDATDQPLVEQELEGTVNRRPADRRQLCRQRFGGEVLLAARYPFDDLMARRRDLKALIAELAHESIGYGGKRHAAIISTRHSA